MIDNSGPLGLWISEQALVDPMKLRLEMAMNRGFEIIVPDRFIPHMELEPLTEDELIKMANRAFWYKKANINRLRSVIKKYKLNATIHKRRRLS